LSVSDHAPVLLYHRISRAPVLAGTWVTPAMLERQLDLLLAQGCRPLTPAAWLALRGRPPADSFLVTCDDGTEDLYRHREIFLQRGIKGVVFIPAALIGLCNRWEWSLPTRTARHLDFGQLRTLVDSGWEVGLHGATHRDLRRLSDAELQRELITARVQLSEQLGTPIHLISYPFGLVNHRVAMAVQQAEYQAGFVVASAPSGLSPRFTVRRRPVYCIDTAESVLVKVTEPSGRTYRGRWELLKERWAHAVGQTAAGLKGQIAVF